MTQHDFIWDISTGGYQAIDEKVDGGVDYGQVPGDKVSEPLMTWHHLSGLVFECKSFFPHLTSKIFLVRQLKKLLVLIWPLIKTFQTSSRKSLHRSEPRSWPTGQAKAHFLLRYFFSFKFETLLDFWKVETNLQNKPDFRTWKWTSFNTLVLYIVLVDCGSCLFIQISGLEVV